MEMYIIQKQLESLRKLVTSDKIVVIYGARRTGKTTLIKEFLKNEVEPYIFSQWRRYNYPIIFIEPVSRKVDSIYRLNSPAYY